MLIPYPERTYHVYRHCRKARAKSNAINARRSPSPRRSQSRRMGLLGFTVRARQTATVTAADNGCGCSRRPRFLRHTIAGVATRLILRLRARTAPPQQRRRWLVAQTLTASATIQSCSSAACTESLWLRHMVWITQPPAGLVVARSGQRSPVVILPIFYKVTARGRERGSTAVDRRTGLTIESRLPERETKKANAALASGPHACLLGDTLLAHSRRRKSSRVRSRSATTSAPFAEDDRDPNVILAPFGFAMVDLMLTRRGTCSAPSPTRPRCRYC